MMAIHVNMWPITVKRREREKRYDKPQSLQKKCLSQESVRKETTKKKEVEKKRKKRKENRKEERKKEKKTAEKSSQTHFEAKKYFKAEIRLKSNPQNEIAQIQFASYTISNISLSLPLFLCSLRFLRRHNDSIDL